MPRRLLPLLLVATLGVVPANAQMPQILDPPPKPWPRVMVVGTVHLANPGADAVKTKIDDVFSPERQRQIESVVEALARFQPTKIAVERVPAMEETVNAAYRSYLAGAYELTRNEIDQIGMRLAKKLGHQRLYAIDHHLGLDFESAMKYAAMNGQQEQIAWFTGMTQRLERYFSDLYSRGTIAEILAPQNDDVRADEGIALYQLMSRIGKDSSYVGADIASDWYKRNIRIYTNTLRLIDSPNDRLLVLIGGGHRPLLRQMFMQTPGYEFVPTLPYLRPMR